MLDKYRDDLKLIRSVIEFIYSRQTDLTQELDVAITNNNGFGKLQVGTFGENVIKQIIHRHYITYKAM